MQGVHPVVVLDKIADLLEELGEPFDYLLNTGEKVVVVRALCSCSHFLYEAETVDSLLNLLERKRDEVNGLFE